MSMKIPFGTITITDTAKKIIKEILRSKRVSSGKYVREFEEKFAKLIGTKEAVAVSSGTDALTLALSVLYDYGAERGDEIIVPALSFVATGNAVINAGFIPRFVDIEIETLNINSDKIEEVINRKTRAIISVHLMGKPCDMDRINNIAKKYRLFVIEDAAEAHGAEYKGKKIGSLGDMAAYSLYLAHIISTVEGGIITTNNSKFADILRSLRSHGRACKCKVCILNTSSGYCKKRFRYGRDIRFCFQRIGYSSKMNELEAAIGLGALEIYEKILEKRRRNLIMLMRKFQKFNDFFITIKEESYERIGPHAFPLIIKESAPFSRDEFMLFLEKKGIETRDLFSCMPTQCKGFSFLGYKLGDFPNAEFIGNHGLHIGVHQDISEKDIDYIIGVIEDFIKKYKN